MTFMEWIKVLGRRAVHEVTYREPDDTRTEMWQVEEEHRQIQEVRHRLERVAQQIYAQSRKSDQQ
jgi:hypothetical protein